MRPTRRTALAAAAGLAAGRTAAQPPTAGLTVRMFEPQNLEGPAAELADTLVTPTDKFYVRNHFAVPKLDADAFRLTVDGLVDRPLSLSLADLRAMACVSRTLTLECAGNGRVFLTPPVPGLQWGHGAVGTATWDGVPLGAVLDRAKVKPGAAEVVLTGADSGTIAGPPSSPGAIPFDRGIPLAKCRRDEVLLAWGMNGQPLTPAHGFPLRAVVGGWYGMAAVKWLTRLTVVDRPYTGFWQTLDYSYFRRDGGRAALTPITDMQPKAVIARPANNEVVPGGGPYRVSGLAWSGDPRPVRVEVSTDGGTTWKPAVSVSWRHRPYTWQPWWFEWTPAGRGPVGVVARATDAAGRTQPARRDPDRRTYMINHLIPTPVTVV
jgi:DMSO/TMAO reductase YedYZ molybdopterin-dependent catalytic subunit